MPLTLVTGPANAEKAGHVLAASGRRSTARRCSSCRRPPDVERYRRELASAGAVFGVEVLRFGWLEREVARRAAVGGRPLGPLAARARGGARGWRDAARPARPLAATPASCPPSCARRRPRSSGYAGALVAALRAWAADAPRSRPTPRSSARGTAPTVTA